jgi:hypothetical protein
MTSRLKIYQFAHSPFCVAIVQAVRAAGIEPELVHVSNAGRSEIIRLTGGATIRFLSLRMATELSTKAVPIHRMLRPTWMNIIFPVSCSRRTRKAGKRSSTDTLKMRLSPSHSK